jgi:hypothetical protein
MMDDKTHRKELWPTRRKIVHVLHLLLVSRVLIVFSIIVVNSNGRTNPERYRKLSYIFLL